MLRDAIPLTRDEWVGAKIKTPTKCTTCHKTGEKLRPYVDGTYECSHIECAVRKGVTASAGDNARVKLTP